MKTVTLTRKQMAEISLTLPKPAIVATMCLRVPINILSCDFYSYQKTAMMDASFLQTITLSRQEMTDGSATWGKDGVEIKPGVFEFELDD
jgi:hypothetical protein